MAAKQRIDEALLERGLCESLEIARALIMAGRVYLGEQKVLKPSEVLDTKRALSVRFAKHPYVSRGGLKLAKAMEVFDIELCGRVCMDVGASTGGFTDVMLRSGAKLVYAIDVAYGQLDYAIRSNPKVCVMERTNARFLTPDQFEVPPSFGATDVSFISLKAVLPACLSALKGEDRRFVALIKPQFEAPPELVGEKGVVRDPKVHEQVVRSIIGYAASIGWTAQNLSFSPVTGPEGNIEFLLDLVPAERRASSMDDADVSMIIEKSHMTFL